MAFIYCSLHRVASNKAQKKAGSFPQVKQPQREPVEEQFGGGKAMLEIHCISTNNSQFSRASYAINNYRQVSCLEMYFPMGVGDDVEREDLIGLYLPKIP